MIEHLCFASVIWRATIGRQSFSSPLLLELGPPSSAGMVPDVKAFAVAFVWLSL